MAALGLFFVLLFLLIVSAGLVIVGIILLRRHHAHKTQPLFRYGIDLPAGIQLIGGAVLIVLGGLFLFWAIWSGAEWVIMTQ